MTVRKLLVLAAVACALVAAISLAGLDWFALSDRDVHEDAFGWGFLGLALFAASSYPAAWMDRGWFR